MAAEIMIGRPFMAAMVSAPVPGWEISTSGSFWKNAATASTGMPCCAIAIAAKLPEESWKSTTPAATCCGGLVCGPPMRIVTSSPCFW